MGYETPYPAPPNPSRKLPSFQIKSLHEFLEKADK